jgi:hypothetical protein
MVRSQPRQIIHETLSCKNPSQKRTGGVAQGVALSSNPSATKKKKKKTTMLRYILADQNGCHQENKKQTLERIVKRVESAHCWWGCKLAIREISI